MSRSTAIVAALVGTALCTGCGATTKYTPQVVAPGELYARYDDNVELWAGNDRIAASWGYAGLPEYVACVPEAAKHAQAARSSGTTATALSIVGGVLGMSSLSGLGGVAYLKSDPVVADVWIGAALAAGATGIVLAAMGRGYKNDANGHAIDAMNYYNDAVGVRGGTCKAPP